MGWELGERDAGPSAEVKRRRPLLIVFGRPGLVVLEAEENRRIRCCIRGIDDERIRMASLGDVLAQGGEERREPAVAVALDAAFMGRAVGELHGDVAEDGAVVGFDIDDHLRHRHIPFRRGGNHQVHGGVPFRGIHEDTAEREVGPGRDALHPVRIRILEEVVAVDGRGVAVGAGNQRQKQNDHDGLAV